MGWDAGAHVSYQVHLAHLAGNCACTPDARPVALDLGLLAKKWAFIAGSEMTCSVGLGHTFSCSCPRIVTSYVGSVCTGALV